MASSRYAFVLLLFSATTQLFLFGECADVKTIKKAFPFDGFAFDVTVNTKACGEAVEDLKYNSSIANYDQIMSFKLKRLSEKGGWLKIHPGVYPLTRPISIPSRVCFTGTNSSEVVLQARIPPMKGSSAIRLKGVTRVSVAHITLINNATNSIHVSDSTYTYFNSVSAAGAAGSNLYITGGHHHAVYRGTFGLCKSNCVSIVNSRQVSVAHSDISDCGKHGIRVGGSGYIRLAACRVLFDEKASINSCAISMGRQGGMNSSAILVTGNVLHDARRGGICGQSTKTLIIEDNNITSEYWEEGDCITIGESIDELDLLGGNYCDNGGFSSF